MACGFDVHHEDACFIHASCMFSSAFFLTHCEQLNQIESALSLSGSLLKGQRNQAEAFFEPADLQAELKRISIQHDTSNVVSTHAALNPDTQSNQALTGSLSETNICKDRENCDSPTQRLDNPEHLQKENQDLT